MSAVRTLAVGAHRLTLIRDLVIACPLRVMLSAAQRPIWEPLAGPTDDEGRVPLPVNCLLIETGGRKILVDAGDGFRPERPAEKNGRLVEYLAALGTAPGEIDTVFLTHLHTDHVLGLTRPTDQGPEPVFGEAAHLVSTPEAERMADPARRLRPDAHMRPFDEQAAETYDVVDAAGLLRTIVPGTPIAPGITPLHTPGHASGQCSLLIEDDGEALLYLADVFHWEFEFEHVELYGDADPEPERVPVSKREMIALARSRDAILAASHLPDFARLRTDADGRVVGLLPVPPRSS
jgi:glyoxylase-like metal-dependent hydrolase (beta-lactamase superfamily II)